MTRIKGYSIFLKINNLYQSTILSMRNYYSSVYLLILLRMCVIWTNYYITGNYGIIIISNCIPYNITIDNRV